jgi:Tol biopolymer transport system component
MTAFDQFDPFEQRISSSLEEIAPARRPDYLDDLLRQTARTSQRPRWSFPGRWLPIMDTTASRGMATHGLARPLVLVALLALLALAASAILIVGSRPKLPLPVGPAGNGAIVYPSRGDLYIKDDITSDAPGRLLVGGSSKQFAPFLSPDGRTVVFAQTGDGGDYMWAVDIDGKNPRQILRDPIQEGWSQWSWALDSRHLLASGFFPGGAQRLYDVQADGSGARELVFEGLSPWEGFWSPTDPNTFLLRAQDRTMARAQHLYLVNADGTNLRDLHLPGQSSFGPNYTLSGAVWSPDGKTIAYNAVDLDRGPGLVTNFRVHIVNADGTNDRALPGPADPRTNEAWPVFSPDGTQLLVQRFRFPTDGAKDGRGAIAVLPVDGSAPAREIGYRKEQTDNPDTGKDWSPDGKHVLQIVDQTLTTYLVDPVTGSATLLSWPDDMPSWQRVAR